MIAEHFLPTAPLACLNAKLRYCRFSAFSIGPDIHTYLVNKIISRLNFNNKPFKAQWLLYLPPGLSLLFLILLFSKRMYISVHTQQFQ